MHSHVALQLAPVPSLHTCASSRNLLGTQLSLELPGSLLAWELQPWFPPRVNLACTSPSRALAAPPVPRPGLWDTGRKAGCLVLCNVISALAEAWALGHTPPRFRHTHVGDTALCLSLRSHVFVDNHSHMTAHPCTHAHTQPGELPCPHSAVSCEARKWLDSWLAAAFCRQESCNPGCQVTQPRSR